MSATSPSVRVERQGQVTTIVLSRPEVKNAIDEPTAALLLDAFLAFEADAEASVAVLWGEGGTFCAGADLKSIAAGVGLSIEPMAPNDPKSRGPLGPTRLALSKPSIAAVSGYAVAGGLELALFCDLRVVEADATFGVFCRRWGVPLIDGGTVRLPRLIGMSRALDLILTGRAVGAEEALAMGLANRVVAKGHARAEAERLARELATLPQACLRHDRQSAYEQWDRSVQDALANELAHGLATIAAGDIAEGATRFTRRRAKEDV
jgi:enoyl-CoA hydratase